MSSDMNRQIASQINRNLKLSQLQAFVAVADCQSFSAAALELELSQSTVSHAIASLEATLGVPLLQRGRQGASLSPIGTALLPKARQVLALLLDMQQQAQAGSSPVIRVASVRSIATHCLPEAIARFRQQTAGEIAAVEIAICGCDYYPEVEQMLRAGQADIGLTLLPAAAEFETWELIQDEFVALLPADDAPESLSWEQLLQYPMIMNPVAAPHLHTRTVQKHLAQFGYRLNLVQEVKDDSTIISLVKQGLGAAIMARLAAEPIPPEVRVCSLPVPLRRSIGVAMRPEAKLPKALLTFLEILQQVCRSASAP
jgi:DNA-binding transcriptional LysR family regulator